MRTIEHHQLSSECKAKLINADLFGRFKRSKILRQTVEENSSQVDSQPRQHPTVVIIHEGKDAQLLKLATAKK